MTVALLIPLALAGCGDDETTDGAGGAGATGGTSNTGGGDGGSGAAGGSGGGEGGSGAMGGAGPGGAGPGGAGGGGMGAPQACMDCFPMAFPDGSDCLMNIQACDADPACNEWKDCSETCFAEDHTQACYDACDAAHPADAGMKQAQIDCLCGACATVCPVLCR